MPKLIKHSTKGLTEQQWQDLRKTFAMSGKVGGSDISVLLGENKYKSPIVLFYQALDLYPEKFYMNESVFHGKHLEKYVADMWQYFDGTEEGLFKNFEQGNKVNRYTKQNAIIENPKYPSLFANCDGIITKHNMYGKKKGVLEVKTISWMVHRQYEGEIPPGYLLQLNHYMLVLGLTYGDIVYFKDGGKLGLQTFDADKEIQQNILHAADDFFDRVNKARADLEINKLAPDEEKLLIASQYEPKTDHSVSLNDYLTGRHKNKPNPNAIRGNEEHQLWAEKFIEYKEKEQEMLTEKTAYQNKLKNFMDINSANELLLPEGKVKWNKMFIVTI